MYSWHSSNGCRIAMELHRMESNTGLPESAYKETYVIRKIREPISWLLVSKFPVGSDRYSVPIGGGTIVLLLLLVPCPPSHPRCRPFISGVAPHHRVLAALPSEEPLEERGVGTNFGEELRERKGPVGLPNVKLVRGEAMNILLMFRTNRSVSSSIPFLQIPSQLPPRGFGKTERAQRNSWGRGRRVWN